MNTLRTILYIPIGITLLVAFGIAYLGYCTILAAVAFYDWVMEDELT